MVIAVAEMSDLQRRTVRLRRPLQQTAMRVPDYYKRFCDWKEEMICVGHPDDEASYIDDFIDNLQWHLRLRVSERRSSMSRLIDAYYAANFDETMILVEEVIKDLRARNVIDEMAGRIPIADIFCDSMEEEFVEKKHQAEAISTSTFADLQSPPINEDPNSAISTEIPVVEVIHNAKQLEMAECWELEENDGSVCGKIAVQNEAVKVFDEMSWDVESQPNVKPNGVQQVKNLVSVTPIAEIRKEQVNEPYAHYLFDELPRPFLVEQSDRNAGNVGKEADVLPFVDLQSALSSEYEATVNGCINSSTKAWFEKVSSIMVAVLSKNVREDDAHKVIDKMSKLTSMKQNFKIDGLEEMVLSIVRLPRVLSCGSEVTDELLMFIFDPGGYSSLQMGHILLEFKHCCITFQTLYMLDILPKTHTLLEYAFKQQDKCPPCSHSKRKLRYETKWYDKSENHHGEKFDNRSTYTSSLRVMTVGLIVNGEAAPEFYLLKLDGLDDIRHLFDQMPRRISAELKKEIFADKDFILPLLDCILQIFYHGSSLIIDDIIFDLGDSSWHQRKSCDFIDLSGVKYDFDKMAGNSNVELGVGKVLLFAFDPGGNSWFHNGKQHLDNAFKPRFDVVVENVLIMVRKYQYKTMLEQTEEYDVEQYNRQNGLDRIRRLIPRGTMLKVIGVSLRSRYWIEFFLRHLIALHSFYTFSRMTEVKEIVEVCDPSYRDIFEDTKHKITMDFKFAVPRKGRQDSVHSGWDVEKVLKDGLLIGAVVLGVPATATIKEAGKDDECSPYEAWLDNFVWDPSQCAIFAYILEDKDVFERVGKDIVLMDITLVIRRYDHERQMGCLDDIGFSWEDFGAELEHYIWDPGSLVSVSLLSWEDFWWRFFFFSPP